MVNLRKIKKDRKDKEQTKKRQRKDSLKLMNKRIINIKGQGKWKDYEFEKE